MNNTICNYSAPTSSFSRHANTTYCAFNDGKKGSILANEWCFSIKPQHMVVSGANLPIYVLNSYYYLTYIGLSHVTYGLLKWQEVVKAMGQDAS